MIRRDVLSQRFPLLPYAVTFYLLQEIGDSRWDEFYWFLVDSLQKVFYDYIPIAAMGEARHGGSHCHNHTLSGMQSRHLSRWMMQYKSVSYNPKTSMPILYEFFGKDWQKSFGGKKWQIVVEAWLRRDELPVDLWVHQVLGLVHNGGYIFDKCPLLLFSGEYVDIMDIRRKYTLQDSMRFHSVPILQTWPESLAEYLIEEEITSQSYLRVQFPMAYTPVRWGKKAFDWEIIWTG